MTDKPISENRKPRTDNRDLDSVSDLLARIKNGYLARKTSVVSPASKMRKAILAILKKRGYIADFKEKEKTGEIEIILRYEGRNPAMTDIKRVSKPGLRVYSSWQRIPRVMSGMGICILSTSRGVMSDNEARKLKVGGEVVCKVW